MPPSDSPFDVLVVGAGLSGLLAAGSLESRGYRVLVLDKARGVGGRMATRRIESLVADHGAQFFTAHDPVFHQRTLEWEQAGLVRRWSTGFAIPDGTIRDNGVPRYCGVNGMASIAKHLAQNLDVRLRSKVTRVEAGAGGDGWTATTDEGTTHCGRGLLLTAPVPQSLALLAAGNAALPEPVGGELGRIDYAPCLALLVQLAADSRIPAPGGLWLTGEPLLWMADNRRKGLGSAAGTVVTLHAGSDFSAERWDDTEPEVTAALLAAAAPWLGSEIVGTQLHRWRYSVPLRVHPDSHLALRQPAPLVFAGDAFGGPRIESAALSGLAAAAAFPALIGAPVSAASA